MIREMMQVLTGRRDLETTSRRRRRFQPGLGLGSEGLEMRLAPSGMGMGPAPAEQAPSTPPSNDSTNVTVTNQDDGNPVTMISDTDTTMLGD